LEPAIKERRGRPAKITPSKLKALQTARKRLQTKHGEHCEVTYKMIKGKARVRASDSVISRAFLKAGIRARSLREKPIRPKEAEKERVAKCKVEDQRRGGRARGSVHPSPTPETHICIVFCAVRPRCLWVVLHDVCGCRCRWDAGCV